MGRKDIIRSVVQAVDEFNSRRLWTRFANFHCFGVRFSDRGDFLLGVVLAPAARNTAYPSFGGPRRRPPWPRSFAPAPWRARLWATSICSVSVWTSSAGYRRKGKPCCTRQTWTPGLTSRCRVFWSRSRARGRAWRTPPS